MGIKETLRFPTYSGQFILNLIVSAILGGKFPYKIQHHLGWIPNREQVAIFHRNSARKLPKNSWTTWKPRKALTLGSELASPNPMPVTYPSRMHNHGLPPPWRYGRICWLVNIWLMVDGFGGPQADRYKWSSNHYTWTYRYLNGVLTLLIGVITTLHL